MGKSSVKKIQDDDKLYKCLRYYVDFVLKLSYKDVIYVGTENMPKDGAIIYAPNHTNALMDALVLLAIDSKPKVFVARADIFKNPKLAKIFTFLKILPIMRQRDGFNEVKKNHETITKAVDVLKDRIPFCIFPEGTHHAKYSSLPLSKGIFRIAFQAQELMPEVPLYIIPVGLRYGDFFRYRSTVRVQIGKPIQVGAFIEEHAELTPQEQINAMKNLLTEHIHSSIFYIPDDHDYDAIYEICNVAYPDEIEELLTGDVNKKKHELDLQFMANKNTLSRIDSLKENDSDKANKLLELGREAAALRKSKGINIESASVTKPLLSRITSILFALITLPYTLSVSVFSIPMVLICEYLFTLLKDPAFKNSARYLACLLVWPLLMIIYFIIACILLPWQWAILAILLILPAPIVAHELWKVVRLTLSDIKLLREKKLRQIYTQIRSLVMKK